MADPGKLIDADALCDGIESQYPWIWSNIGRSLRALILSKPDASEPLRERIAELEDQKNKAVELLEECSSYTYYTSEAPWSVQADVKQFLSKQTGAQDA